MKKFFLGLFFSLASLATTVSPFELPDMTNQGKLYSSKTQNKKVFVVEAYFINCPYCNENAPNVNALAKKYASHPSVQVLDVGVDRKDSDYEEWIRRHEPNHPVLKDAQKKLIKELGTTGYPSTYVINAAHEVIYETAGVWGTEEEESLVQAIDSLLNK